MFSISNRKKKYWSRDEIVNEEFKLKDQDVFISSDRLFIKNDNNVRYIDYSNISSIELLIHRQLLVIGIGILLIGSSLYLQYCVAPNWIAGFAPGKLLWRYNDGGSIFIIVGIILMLAGFLWKRLSIRFKINSPYN